MEDGFCTVEVSHLDGLTIITTAGELDAQSAPLFDAVLADMAEGTRAVVDMEKVSFMDSGGIYVLVKHSTRLAESGGSLRVRNPSSGVQRLLQITGLEDRFRYELP
jgi:anti-anti-sigma factor